MEAVVFVICAALALFGAGGVVLARNPVHSALFLVMTLFAIAVLFLNLDAQFLAAVQVIVYAGAIVVLFLFVIMLLGVDQAEDLQVEPIAGQRPIAIVLGAAVLGLGIAFVAFSTSGTVTGQPAATAERLDSLTGDSQIVATDLGGNIDAEDGTEEEPNIDQLGRVIFTDYVYAFEITALLLTIAVVGAVVLARRPAGELQPIPEARVFEPLSDDEDDAANAESAPGVDDATDAASAESGGGGDT